MNLEKIINEYSKEYCHMLELAYGSHMMSEGGSQEIEQMFAEVSLQNKKALDIGFGLGGVMFYLAEHYAIGITGLEINPWLVEEAYRRTPEVLKKQLEFLTYHPQEALGFVDQYFDLVFSKGVLTHLEDKTFLFSQVNRILKPEGDFVICDWLSETEGKWGKRIQTLCERESLSIFAQTEASYSKVLENTGFKVEKKINQHKARLLSVISFGDAP